MSAWPNSVNLLREKASKLRYISEVGAEAEADDYQRAAELLERLGEGGGNQVAPVRVGTDLATTVKGLHVAALFIGINEEAAQRLVELVEYIRSLEQRPSETVVLLNLARSMIRDMAHAWPAKELVADPRSVVEQLTALIGDNYNFEDGSV